MLKYDVTSLLGQLYKQDHMINTKLKFKKQKQLWHIVAAGCSAYN